MVFHGSDPDKLAGRLDDGVALLSSSGATLVLFTGPDWGSTPVLGRNRSKVAVFNENIREIASRHNALIADLWGLRELRDPRMWDRDRLHLSPPGHYAVAMRVLDALGVRHPLQPLQAGDLPQGDSLRARAEDLVWARTYLLPAHVGVSHRECRCPAINSPSGRFKHRWQCKHGGDPGAGGSDLHWRAASGRQGNGGNELAQRGAARLQRITRRPADALLTGRPVPRQGVTPVALRPAHGCSGRNSTV